ncbi:TPA: DNA mismatch repair protein MutT [Bacillus cereus]|nr:DNA mismatch repair protein MutT [Bacillus thuringiensis]HDR4762059.1 DNA mismatch repair protein MutT [Bacillus cereus]HDR4795299.1 DNA mismatch repair protein MutT [Bacillus cereus]HDR4801729.1 DNA mismatch repair protein MutT [Bacillus cereus]HDR4807087.1 DNA mismatch repair protein MutT [Bacillus cereus]
MGYIEELRKVVGSRPLNLVGVAVAVFNEQGQIKETFLKAFFYFTSACKQDLKCPSANSCPCALKDATAFS